MILFKYVKIYCKQYIICNNLQVQYIQTTVETDCLGTAVVRKWKAACHEPYEVQSKFNVYDHSWLTKTRYVCSQSSRSS